MAQPGSGNSERIPEETRAAFAQLYQDVTMLHHKWHLYLELFSTQQSATLLSNVAQACFQVIAESLRNDMLIAICRLSDPSHWLGSEYLSLATLVARCSKVPNVDALLTAFQSAAGPVRLLRNRRILHNDLHTRIVAHDDPFPGIDRSQIEEILRLASAILKAVRQHVADDARDLPPLPIGLATDLIECLQTAWAQRERRLHRSEAEN
jgi:hypothetical protein